MLKRFALLSLVVLAACGSPEAGDSCSPENSLVCQDSVNALFCEGGKLAPYSCRGPGGCINNGTSGTCDVQRARAGDPCPKLYASTAQCSSSDANQGLVCTGGSWKAQACKACAVQGGNVVCQP